MAYDMFNQQTAQGRPNRYRDAAVSAIAPQTSALNPMIVANQAAQQQQMQMPGTPMDSKQPAATLPGSPTDSEGPGGFGGTQGSGPSSPSMGGGANPWDGKTGAALANDPAYIRAMSLQTLVKRYGSEDKIPAGQLDYMIQKISNPDTFSDQNIRQGWNPYWEDRFGNPASQGGSAVDAGTDTIIGREQGPPRGPGHTVENALNGFNGGGGSPNAAMANLIGSGGATGLNGLLQGDPFSRIQDSLQKINGNGQVNLDALIRQLQGA